MRLFILYFESVNYCGYGHHAVVRAQDGQEACDKAAPFMEEYFQEQDEDQYVEENGTADDVSWACLMSCEPFDKDHEDWQYVIDPGQASFYEFIGVTQEELIDATA